jgi:hypothetical protein
MRCVGFAFQKGQIRVVALEGGAPPILLSSRTVRIDHTLPAAELMDRYRRDFLAVIEEDKPDVVATRFNYNSGSISDAHNLIMPGAILALACHSKQVMFREISLIALRSPGPFGLPPKTKPVDQVDRIFGQHPPHWDKVQKETLLAAWRALP